MNLNELRKLAGMQLTEAAGNSLIHISYPVEGSQGYNHVIGPETVIREAFIKMLQQMIKDNPKATNTVAKLGKALSDLEEGKWKTLSDMQNFQINMFSPNEIIEIEDHGESSKLKASDIENVARAAWYPFGDLKDLND